MKRCSRKCHQRNLRRRNQIADSLASTGLSYSYLKPPRRHWRRSRQRWKRFRRNLFRRRNQAADSLTSMGLSYSYLKAPRRYCRNPQPTFPNRVDITWADGDVETLYFDRPKYSARGNLNAWAGGRLVREGNIYRVNCNVTHSPRG
jgi:hypothetical protein